MRWRHVLALIALRVLLPVGQRAGSGTGASIGWTGEAPSPRRAGWSRRPAAGAVDGRISPCCGSAVGRGGWRRASDAVVVAPTSCTTAPASRSSRGVARAALPSSELCRRSADRRGGLGPRPAGGGGAAQFDGARNGARRWTIDAAEALVPKSRRWASNVQAMIWRADAGDVRAKNGWIGGADPPPRRYREKRENSPEGATPTALAAPTEAQFAAWDSPAAR